MSVVSAIYYDIRMRENLGGDFARVRTVLGDMFNSLGAMMQASLSARVVNAIVQAPYKMAESIYELGRSVQFSRTTFETMLGDVNRGGIMLQQLRDYARDFALPVPDVLRFGQQILAMGFNAEQVVPVLHRMAQAAAISPVGIREMMSRLTLAVGQIRAAGFLRGQELRQLTEAGIPVLDILRQKMGKTTAEIQDMMRKSQLDASTFLTNLFSGLDERIGDILLKRQSTFYGMIEVIQAAWTGLLADLGDVTGTMLAPAYQGEAGFFRSDAWEEMKNTIISGYAGALRLAIGLSDQFSRILSIIGQEISNLISPFGSVQDHVGGFIDAVIDGVTWLADFLDRNRDLVRNLIIVGGVFAAAVAGTGVFYAGLMTVVGAIGMIVSPLGALIAGVLTWIGLATATENNWIGVLTNLGVAVQNWRLVWDVMITYLQLTWSRFTDMIPSMWQNFRLHAIASFNAVLAGAREFTSQLMGKGGIIEAALGPLRDVIIGLIRAMGGLGLLVVDMHKKILDDLASMAGAVEGAARPQIDLAAIMAEMDRAYRATVERRGGFRYQVSDETRRLEERLEINRRRLDFERRRAEEDDRRRAGERARQQGGPQPRVPVAPGLPFFPPGDAAAAEEEEKKKAKEPRTPGIAHIGFAEFSRRLQESLTPAAALAIPKAQLAEAKKVNEKFDLALEIAKQMQKELKKGKLPGFGP